MRTHRVRAPVERVLELPLRRCDRAAVKQGLNTLFNAAPPRLCGLSACQERVEYLPVTGVPDLPGVGLEVRHRSEVPEYRVEQHEEAARERLGLLRSGA